MSIETELHNQLPSLEGILDVVQKIPIDHWSVKKIHVKGLEPSLSDHYLFVARYGQMVQLDKRGIYRIEIKAPVPTAPRNLSDLAKRSPKDIIMPLGEYTLTFSKGEENHAEISTVFNGSIIWGDQINTAINREYKRLLVAYAKYKTSK
ncbi:hypothetical protein HZA97_01810 [Candidatus Woesearchaeota archaeon]|nr:hypothetical protein [Candidatus Woesearchaeota archaeon]